MAKVKTSRKLVLSPLVKAVWCPTHKRWMEPHDFAVCEAPEHTEIAIGMRSVYNLLNGLRRLHKDAMSEGFESLAGEINEMYEDATWESLENEV
jgi:hypothetical protein